MTANIVINFSLTDGIQSQLDTLDTLLPLLEKRGITIASRAIVSALPADRDKGVYESNYLRLSGKKFIRLTKGQTDREATARKLIEIEFSDNLAEIDALAAATPAPVESSTEDVQSEADAPETPVAETEEDDSNIF